MNLDTTLALLAEHPNAEVDLARVALLVAAEEFAHLDVEGYLSELDAMAHELRPKLRGRLSSRVEHLSRYLFHEMGFAGNQDDYYNPANSYLNLVLDQRLGLPITLSLLAMSVGRRAGLEIHGVGLPGHFIAKAVSDSEHVLFDPFHGGEILDHSDCEEIVRSITGLDFTATANTLQATTTSAFVVRLLSNLKAVYLQNQDYGRAARVIARLCQVLPEDVSQRRDLGICLLENNQPGRSIIHLEHFLESEQSGSHEEVEKLLLRARNSVAKWN